MASKGPKGSANAFYRRRQVFAALTLRPIQGMGENKAAKTW